MFQSALERLPTSLVRSPHDSGSTKLISAVRTGCGVIRSLLADMPDNEVSLTLRITIVEYALYELLRAAAMLTGLTEDARVALASELAEFEAAVSDIHPTKVQLFRWFMFHMQTCSY